MRRQGLARDRGLLTLMVRGARATRPTPTTAPALSASPPPGLYAAAGYFYGASKAAPVRYLEAVNQKESARSRSAGMGPIVLAWSGTTVPDLSVVDTKQGEWSKQ